MATMWAFITILLSGLLCCALGQIEEILPKVNISQGTVVGSVPAGENYVEFHGIPYADSTSGFNRFKAPLPPPIFEDEFIANRKDVKCVRALGVGYEGTEDCLVIDIYTPTLNSSRQLPVMVWLKGKELDHTTDPELSYKKFIEKDVVIVKINYRESILGFLCLGTESAPGNAGLKDVIAGLRWIQENIAVFGGSPDNVSLFGHGSGAAIVDLITLTPLAEGLIHKAIAQSGTALAPWAVTRNNLQYALNVAEALGHNAEDLDTLSEILSRINIAALMAVINELDLTDNSLAFAPCVERSIVNVEPLLLKSPYQIITEGEQLQIPFLTGFVDIEGTVRADKATHSDWLERMNESFGDFIQPDLEFLNETEELDIAQEIKTFYFNDQPVNVDSISSFLKYHGDTMILTSAIRETRMRATSSNTPVYLYQFSYKGNLGDTLEISVPVDSARHREELFYLFRDENNINASIYDLDISDILIERWTNFAKNGIPTSETSNVTWQPFTLFNSHYLRVLDDEEISDSNLDIDLENPHPETMTFWDTIYARYFLDAESQWSLNVRNETVEEENIDSSTETPDVEEDNNQSTPAPDENEEDNPSTPSPEAEDSPDSASTAIGYTFTILTLFAIINKFHSLQILS